MLTDFLTNLRVLLVFFVFLGFGAFGAFVIGLEYKYYKTHFKGTFKYHRQLFWLVVLATLGVLLFIYDIFFERMLGFSFFNWVLRQ